MIKKTQAFVASDNRVYPTLESAQLADLESLASKAQQPDYASVAKFVFDQKDLIMDILTTSPSSRPPARKINGGTKPRKAKVSFTEAKLVAQAEAILTGTQHT